MKQNFKIELNEKNVLAIFKDSLDPTKQKTSTVNLIHSAHLARSKAINYVY